MILHHELMDLWVGEVVEVIKKKQSKLEIEQELQIHFLHSVKKGKERKKGDHLSIGWEIRNKSGKKRFVHAAHLIFKAISMSAKIECPEHLLYLNIIRQAITDSLNFSEEYRIRMWRREAYLYFFSKEFIDDCHKIDVRPELVIEYVDVVRKLVKQQRKKEDALASLGANNHVNSEPLCDSVST